jgi:hypothetical protein
MHRVNQLNLADGSAAGYARRARILFEILEESGVQAKPLQWAVAQTYLPNVIFDVSEHARITSGDTIMTWTALGTVAVR